MSYQPLTTTRYWSSVPRFRVGDVIRTTDLPATWLITAIQKDRGTRPWYDVTSFAPSREAVSGGSPMENATNHVISDSDIVKLRLNGQLQAADYETILEFREKLNG